MTSWLFIGASGHIGNVEDFKYTQNGTPLCRFTMAVNVKADRVLWLRVSVFGKLAESIHPHLVQGKHVLIESNDLKLQAYLGGGVPKASCDVIARSVKFMGKRQDAEQPDYAGFDEQPEDIPF